jgi:hypothetical protein
MYRVTYQPTNALNKTQLMTIINPLQGLAPDCHPQAVFQSKGI